MSTPDHDLLARKARIRHAAYHEAGHAVARIVLGGEPTDTWITERGAGESEGTGREWTGANPIDAIPIMTLAGPCAEARVRRVGIVVGLLTFGHDDYQFVRAAAAAGYGRDAALTVDLWTWEARQILTANWSAVERVACVLRRALLVSAADLRSLVGETNYLGRPFPHPRLRCAL